eukprot:9927270-Alexandrium_andersonii.AAC.1
MDSRMDFRRKGIVQAGGVAQQPCLRVAPKARVARRALSLVLQVGECQSPVFELPAPVAGPTGRELVPSRPEPYTDDSMAEGGSEAADAMSLECASGVVPRALA